MNYYISDLHFGHGNAVKYDKRPFADEMEMGEELVRRWNSVVKQSDTVYILGDLGWSWAYDIYMPRLNGKKFLIKGNHDRVSSKQLHHFHGMADYLEVKDSGERVILSHFPILFWNAQHYDSVHLYGHVHLTLQHELCEKWKEDMRQIEGIPVRAFNVGCMVPYMDYTPRTLKEILEANNALKEAVENEKKK